MLQRSVALSLLFMLAFTQTMPAAAGKYTVAAYYYTWYGGAKNPHWPEGVAHKPWIGYYKSANPNVAREQIALAKEYGVDVFGASWTGIGTTEVANLEAGLLKAPNLNDIRFCVLYETIIRLGQGGNSGELIDFNLPATRQTFIADMIYIAQKYFNNPSYFKIQGRPVVNFYVARNFRGNFPGVFQELRAQWHAMGWNPYLVGDALYWGSNDLYIASQFDAVTMYGIFNPALFQNGVNSTADLVQAIRPWYYDLLLTLGKLKVRGTKATVAFQPDVMPQYDDRIARGTTYALLAQSQEQVKEMFQLGRDILDEQSTSDKVVWITSWNEWHEGTSIEPTVSGGSKYPAGNYGLDFLQAVKDVFEGP